MIRSIEEADKPAKRGKKQEKKKEEKMVKGAKGQTPNKWMLERAAPSQPKPKKTKKTARKLILSSSSDSEYVPIGHQPITQHCDSESESESSKEEGSVRGATPPCAPTPEVHVRS